MQTENKSKTVTLTKEIFGGEVEINVECSYVVAEWVEHHGEPMSEIQDIEIGMVTFNDVNINDTALSVLKANGIKHPTQAQIDTMATLLEQWVERVEIDVEDVEDDING